VFIIGLTGGMGAGKSTAASFFTELQISVYNADAQARRLMQENQSLRSALVHHFGKQSYKDNQLNTPFLAKRAFSDTSALKKLNSLVHPVVDSDFKSWVIFQKGPYCLKEAAILFESGSYTQCHWVISVMAFPELRIQRIMQRSHLSRVEVLNRLNYQWSDQERYSRSDIIIENNDGLEILCERVKVTHIKILNLINNSFFL